MVKHPIWTGIGAYALEGGLQMSGFTNHYMGYGLMACGTILLAMGAINFMRQWKKSSNEKNIPVPTPMPIDTSVGIRISDGVHGNKISCPGIEGFGTGLIVEGTAHSNDISLGNVTGPKKDSNEPR